MPFLISFQFVSVGSFYVSDRVIIDGKKDKAALADTRRLNAEGRRIKLTKH